MIFYKKIISQILESKIISTWDSILVVAGGQKDKEVLLSFGFKNVTISNLAPHKGYNEYEPYKWLRLDLENISLEDDKYDWVFVHAGLHHCASPHKGLCEMLRVSKKGVGVIESRDNLLNFLTCKLGITPNYELEPSLLSNGTSGGLRNTHIPNYIYRWTENEVKKTVNSYLPHHKHLFHFYYGLNIPTERLSMSKNVLKRAIARFGEFILPVFMFFFKKQGNLFGFVIEKNIALQPWLIHENDKINFNMEFALKKYDPTKYGK